MEDEYLDLVDEKDNVIGKKKRSEVYKLNLSNFRVVNLFIRNKKGQLWIPRRAEYKERLQKIITGKHLTRKEFEKRIG